MLKHSSATRTDLAACASRTPVADGTGGQRNEQIPWWTSERRELILAQGGFGAKGVANGQLHSQHDVTVGLSPPANPCASEAGEIAEARALSRIRSGMAAIADSLLYVWKLLQREYRIARAVRQLERLDERMLRDIGISRYEIRRNARFGSDRDVGGM